MGNRRRVHPGQGRIDGRGSAASACARADTSGYACTFGCLHAHTQRGNILSQAEIIPRIRLRYFQLFSIHQASMLLL